MYVQVPHLIDFLHNWRCQHSHMYDCMLQLGYDMAVNDFWSPQDLALLTAWVHDLAALGYQPPELKPPPRTPEAQMHFQNVQVGGAGAGMGNPGGTDAGAGIRLCRCCTGAPEDPPFVAQVHAPALPISFSTCLLPLTHTLPPAPHAERQADGGDHPLDHRRAERAPHAPVPALQAVVCAAQR
jgi:hypothetical protein